MMTVVNISREHESRIMREHHKSLVNVLNCSIALTDFGVLSIDKATCINIVRVEMLTHHLRTDHLISPPEDVEGHVKPAPAAVT